VEPLEFFDAHAHLQDPRLLTDADAASGRAGAAGVACMVCCGTHPADWAATAQLCSRQPSLIPAFGLHPWEIASAGDNWFELLAQHLERFPRAGVGEIGLDHAMDPATFARQEDVFRRQLALARDLGRPVSVHCRKAWAAMLEVLRHTSISEAGGMIHSYSGAPDLLPALLDFGLCISFSGTITYPRNKRAHRSIAAVPSDRLLIETDSPDQKPMGILQTCNEPAFLPLVAQAAADLRNTGIREIARATRENGLRLFTVAK
jgi:TatD DNase family protein